MFADSAVWRTHLAICEKPGFSGISGTEGSTIAFYSFDKGMMFLKPNNEQFYLLLSAEQQRTVLYGSKLLRDLPFLSALKL